jgi:hypothetical protein
LQQGRRKREKGKSEKYGRAQGAKRKEQGPESCTGRVSEKAMREMRRCDAVARTVLHCCFFSLLSSLFIVFSVLTEVPQKVLIVVEGKTDPASFAIGDGRHLSALLGHFNVTSTVIGVDEYTPGRMQGFRQVFYIGFHAKNAVPRPFLNDVLAGTTPVMWIHTGFAEFCFARSEEAVRILGQQPGLHRGVYGC